MSSSQKGRTQQTLFQTWKKKDPWKKPNEPPRKNWNALSSEQVADIVSEPIDLTDDDLIEAAELLESVAVEENQPGTSKVKGNTQVEHIPGFNDSAGHIWIYPTNYPVRSYQFSIVRSSLFKNTLVSLPTGLGKTFIAAVVMYNFYRWYPQGKIIFMAPTKPLVSQQIEACYKIMGIPMEDQAEITGMNTPVHKREALWSSKRVFFLTPQVINNDLARGVCPVSLIKCVVIDEAHKAQGKHAYCQVVNQIASCNRNFRVLALSATPGTDVRSVQLVITNLLIAHIEIRSEDSIDIQQFSHRRNVEKVVCKLDETMVKMRDNFLKVVEIFTKSLVSKRALFDREASRYSKYGFLMARDQFRKDPPSGMNKYEMGAVEGEFATCISLYHGLELLLQHGMRSFFIFLKTMMEGDKGNIRAKSVLGSNAVFREIYGDLKGMFGDSPNPTIMLTQAGQARQSMVQGSAQLGQVCSHPKMAKLEEVVLKHFQDFVASSEDDATRVMVFCQYRDSVQEITEILQKHRPLVRPMQFVGHSTVSGKVAKFTQKDQLQVVSKFRAGGYNTLVSTCVGEEGLDIGDVDLIVCFDAHKSPIRLVQRMGRTGRKRKGRIVMLVTEGKEERDYNSSVSNKKSIQKAITGNSSRSLQFYQYNPRMVPLGLNPEPYKMHIVVKDVTGAAANSKGKAKRKLKEPAADISVMMRNVEQKNSVFLNQEQTREWNEKMRLTAKEKEKVKSLPRFGEMLSLQSLPEIQSQRRRGLLSLSEWSVWQNKPQSSSISGHSSATKNFVEIMEICDVIKQSDDANFEENLAPFLGGKYDKRSLGQKERSKIDAFMTPKAKQQKILENIKKSVFKNDEKQESGEETLPKLSSEADFVKEPIKKVFPPKNTAFKNKLSLFSAADVADFDGGSNGADDTLADIDPIPSDPATVMESSHGSSTSGLVGEHVKDMELDDDNRGGEGGGNGVPVCHETKKKNACITEKMESTDDPSPYLGFLDKLSCIATPGGAKEQQDPKIDPPDLHRIPTPPSFGSTSPEDFDMQSDAGDVPPVQNRSCMKLGSDEDNESTRELVESVSAIGDDGQSILDAGNGIMLKTLEGNYSTSDGRSPALQADGKVCDVPSTSTTVPVSEVHRGTMSNVRHDVGLSSNLGNDDEPAEASFIHDIPLSQTFADESATEKDLHPEVSLNLHNASNLRLNATSIKPMTSPVKKLKSPNVLQILSKSEKSMRSGVKMLASTVVKHRTPTHKPTDQGVNKRSVRVAEGEASMLDVSADMFGSQLDIDFDMGDVFETDIRQGNKPKLLSPVLANKRSSDNNLRRNMNHTNMESSDSEPMGADSLAKETLTQRSENQVLFADFPKMQNDSRVLVAEVKPLRSAEVDDEDVAVPVHPSPHQEMEEDFPVDDDFLVDFEMEDFSSHVNDSSKRKRSSPDSSGDGFQAKRRKGVYTPGVSPLCAPASRASAFRTPIVNPALDTPKSAESDGSPLLVKKKKQNPNLRTKILFSQDNSSASHDEEEDGVAPLGGVRHEFHHVTRPGLDAQESPIHLPGFKQRGQPGDMKRNQHSTPKCAPLRLDNDDFLDDGLSFLKNRNTEAARDSRNIKQQQNPGTRVKHRLRDFMEDEAEVSNDGVNVSSDEVEHDNTQAIEEMRGFVNDETHLTQHVGDGTSVDEQAMYLRGLPGRSNDESAFEAHRGRFKLAYDVGNDIDVFSQEVTTDLSGYEEDSFVCDEEVEDQHTGFGEVTLLQNVSDASRMKGRVTRRQAELDKLKKMNYNDVPVEKKQKNEKVEKQGRKRIVCMDDSTDSIESAEIAEVPFKKNVPAAESEKWTCSACTLLNPSTAQICELCDSEKPHSSDEIASEKSDKTQERACKLCTYINRGSGKFCDMCSEPLPEVACTQKTDSDELVGSSRKRPSYPTKQMPTRSFPVSVKSEPGLSEVAGRNYKADTLRAGSRSPVLIPATPVSKVDILGMKKRSSVFSPASTSQLSNLSSISSNCGDREERLRRCRMKQLEIKAKMERRRSQQSLESSHPEHTGTPKNASSASSKASSSGFMKKPVTKNIINSVTSTPSGSTCAARSSLHFTTPDRSSDLINSSMTTPGIRNPSQSEKKVILVDSKELSSSQQIITTLRSQHGVHVIVASLPHCDYIVGKGTVVERKTFSDFSQVSNNQKLTARFQQLNANYNRVYLIIEKDRPKKNNMGTDRQIHSSYYHSTVLALTQTNVRILHSDSQESTANLLNVLVSRERSQKRSVDYAAAEKANDSKCRLLLKMYISIPRVTFVSALYLCLNYKSVKEVASSSVEKLMRNAHMTTSSAAEVYSFFRRNFDLQMTPSK